MSDPTTPVRAGEDAGREAGRIAYEARFAHLGPRHFEPWRTLEPEVKAIWARVERSSAAAAEVEVARLRAERQRCDARIHNQRAVLREWGPETHATRAADARLRLIALARKKSAANRAAEASASALRDRVKVLEEALKPFSDLGTKKGRKGRTAFDGPDDDDVVSTKGETFNQVPDTRRVCLMIEAGHIRRARSALTEGAP